MDETPDRDGVDEVIVDEVIGDEVMIDGVVGGSVTSETEVQSGSGLRSAGVAAAMLGLLLIGLALWPTGDRTGPDADGSAPHDRNGDADPDRPGDGPENGHQQPDRADVGPTAADGLDPAAEVQTAAEAAAIANHSQVSAEGGTAADESVNPTEPGPELLGEPTGLGLIYGTQGFGRFELLELDTGARRELAARGQLMGMMGSTIVAREAESVFLYPLDRVDGAPLRVGAGELVVVLSISEEQLWAAVAWPDPDNARLVAFDRYGADVDGVDEVPVTRQLLSGIDPWDPHGEILQGPAGGIYRRENGGYSQVSTGTLIAVGADVALVRECDLGMACTDSWYDKSDWSTTLNWPAPTIPTNSVTSPAIVGNDRWLRFTDQSGHTTVGDVRTGRTVWSSESPRRGLALRAVALSPDGRWLVQPGFDQMTVVDLQTGRRWPIDAGAEAAQFVDMALVDVAS